MQKTIAFKPGASNEEKLEHLKKEWRTLMNEYVPGYTTTPHEVRYAIIHKAGNEDETYQHNPSQLENADSFSLFYVIVENLKVKDNTEELKWIQEMTEFLWSDSKFYEGNSNNTAEPNDNK